MSWRGCQLLRVLAIGGWEVVQVRNCSEGVSE